MIWSFDELVSVCVQFNVTSGLLPIKNGRHAVHVSGVDLNSVGVPRHSWFACTFFPCKLIARNILSILSKYIVVFVKKLIIDPLPHECTHVYNVCISQLDFAVSKK